MSRLSWIGAALGLAALVAGPPAAPAAEYPLVALTPLGAPEVVFSPKRDACDGDDVPDAPARAFRSADGDIVVFAMHMMNRALRGPDLAHLKIACRPPLASRYNADPARYDDASWITATWTRDGKHVDALLHHEFHAGEHPGRCRFKDFLACWYNSVVAVASDDGGRTFVRPEPPAVVAAPPFRQDVGQGRHRGFFNPSNIVPDGRYVYTMIATTGWDGQPSGACLFRTDTPSVPASWRAYDGKAFTIRYADPYRSDAKPQPCTTLSPFPAPVGAIVRHRDSRAWIAVFQAEKNESSFPVSGFYTTTSWDLIRWDAPRLLLAGPTLYGDPCKSGGRLIAYPSLIDPAATGRNFDDVGDSADLFFSSLAVDGCAVTDRELIRQQVGIRLAK